MIFLGAIAEDELQKLYEGAAVYVYPAPEEDFGMGVIESMAEGVPVVAWNQAGPTVTVGPGTGYLAEPLEVNDYAEGIVEPARQPGRKPGDRRARIRVGATLRLGAPHRHARASRPRSRASPRAGRGGGGDGLRLLPRILPTRTRRSGRLDQPEPARYARACAAASSLGLDGSGGGRRRDTTAALPVRFHRS